MRIKDWKDWVMWEWRLERWRVGKWGNKPNGLVLDWIERKNLERGGWGGGCLRARLLWRGPRRVWRVVRWTQPGSVASPARPPDVSVQSNGFGQSHQEFNCKYSLKPKYFGHEQPFTASSQSSQHLWSWQHIDTHHKITKMQKEENDDADIKWSLWPLP